MIDETLKSNSDTELDDDDLRYAQFCEKHGYKASSLKAHSAYERWAIDVMLDKLEEERRIEKVAAQLAEGIAKSRAEGRVEGKAEGITETMMNFALGTLKLRDRTTNQTLLDGELRGLGVPDEIINAARKQYEVSHGQQKIHNRSKTEPGV